MTVELNEYCLYKIFDFLTPLEWIHIAEVCPSWNVAVSRNWKKIGTCVALEAVSSDWYDEFGKFGVPVISVEDIQKMVHQVAPITESLTIGIECEDFADIFYLNMGSLTYQVFANREKRQDFDETLKIFAQNATELTKLFLARNLPRRETMILLFSQNKITKVCVKDLDIKTICEDHLFNETEDLVYLLNGKELSVSFDEHFPKLKALQLKTKIQSNNELQRLLSQTLPYVNTLKSFKLSVNNSAHVEQFVFALDAFDSIFYLSQLECLMIIFDYDNVQSMDLFLNKLLVCHPQLQQVHIGGISLSNSDVSTLISFPKLKWLGVKPAEDFFPTDFREMENLSTCVFYFDRNNDRARIPVVSMLEKMPNLKHLILSENYNIYYDNFDLVNDIVFRVLLLAASRDKCVLIKIRYPINKTDRCKMLIVEKRKVRKEDFDTKHPFLITFNHLPWSWGTLKRSFDTLLKDVTVFLNENLKDYHAFLYNLRKRQVE